MTTQAPPPLGIATKLHGCPLCDAPCRIEVCWGGWIVWECSVDPGHFTADKEEHWQAIGELCRKQEVS